MLIRIPDELVPLLRQAVKQATIACGQNYSKGVASAPQTVSTDVEQVIDLHDIGDGRFVFDRAALRRFASQVLSTASAPPLHTHITWDADGNRLVNGVAVDKPAPAQTVSTEGPPVCGDCHERHWPFYGCFKPLADKLWDAGFDYATNGGWFPRAEQQKSDVAHALTTAHAPAQEWQPLLDALNEQLSRSMPDGPVERNPVMRMHVRTLSDSRPKDTD